MRSAWVGVDECPKKENQRKNLTKNPGMETNLEWNQATLGLSVARFLSGFFFFSSRSKRQTETES